MQFLSRRTSYTVRCGVRSSGPPSASQDRISIGQVAENHGKAFQMRPVDVFELKHVVVEQIDTYFLTADALEQPAHFLRRVLTVMAFVGDFALILHTDVLEDAFILRQLAAIPKSGYVRGV